MHAHAREPEIIFGDATLCAEQRAPAGEIFAFLFVRLREHARQKLRLGNTCVGSWFTQSGTVYSTSPHHEPEVQTARAKSVVHKTV